MKVANYSKKFHSITLYVQRNVTETKNCYSKAQASALIESTGIEQELKIIA